MRLPLALFLVFLLSPPARSAEPTGAGPSVAPEHVVRVWELGALQQAMAKAAPGTRIEVAPGDYQGGLYLKNVRGTAGHPIVVAAADPKRPPIFHGKIQLVSPAYLELQDLQISNPSGNGFMIDDGGNVATPAHHITVRRLRILGGNPKGNVDGFHISGLDEFLISECQMENWGSPDGSGIDMVGCHRGIIEGCSLKHSADLKITGGHGIQLKGGVREITIRRCRFEHAGQRAINMGGGTGLAYFRPPLKSWTAGELYYEAKEIVAENNLIIGSLTPVCFATAEDCVFRHNTVHLPGRWALRIVQETKEPGFAPCRRGVFADNLIVFRSTAWSEGGSNIGPRTEAGTFTFRHNWWYCQDAPAKSRPKLPAPEAESIYGQDPQLAGAGLQPPPGTPAAVFGVVAP